MDITTLGSPTEIGDQMGRLGLSENGASNTSRWGVKTWGTAEKEGREQSLDPAAAVRSTRRGLQADLEQRNPFDDGKPLSLLEALITREEVGQSGEDLVQEERLARWRMQVGAVHRMSQTVS